MPVENNMKVTTPAKFDSTKMEKVAPSPAQLENLTAQKVGLGNSLKSMATVGPQLGEDGVELAAIVNGGAVKVASTAVKKEAGQTIVFDKAAAPAEIAATDPADKAADASKLDSKAVKPGEVEQAD
ncbi:MAG: hypothetical protein PHF25_00400 [Candidatus Margulisbacteria bacterium]|nr:hypothetical protein [Candidatus Margulisiibacteriota bacterium]